MSGAGEELALYEQLIEGEAVSPTEAEAVIEEADEFLDLLDGDDKTVRYDDEQRLVKVHPEELDLRQRNAEYAVEREEGSEDKFFKYFILTVGAPAIPPMAAIWGPMEYYNRKGDNAVGFEDWSTEDLDALVYGEDTDLSDFDIKTPSSKKWVAGIPTGAGVSAAAATGEPLAGLFAGGASMAYAMFTPLFTMEYDSRIYKNARQELEKRKAREKAKTLEEDGYVIIADTNAVHDAFEEQWPNRELVDRYADIDEETFRDYTADLLEAGDVTDVTFWGNEVSPEDDWIDTLLGDKTYRPQTFDVEQYETASGHVYRAIVRGSVDIGELEPDYVESDRPLLTVDIKTDESEPMRLTESVETARAAR